MLSAQILPAVEMLDAARQVASAQLSEIAHAAGQRFDGIRNDIEL
jgi:hypothetical protein